MRRHVFCFIYTLRKAQEDSQFHIHSHVYFSWESII